MSKDQVRDLWFPGLNTAIGGAVTAITLNDIVACLTALYLIVSTGYAIWKWRREARAARQAQRRHEFG